MTLRSISISNRLISLVTTSLVLLVSVAGYLTALQRGQRLEDRTQKAQNIVETAYSLLNHHAPLRQRGGLTLAKAQKQSRRSINSIRFDGDNTPTQIDAENKVVSHPIKPELNGKNLADFFSDMGKVDSKFIINKILSAVKICLLTNRGGSGATSFPAAYLSNLIPIHT